MSPLLFCMAEERFLLAILTTRLNRAFFVHVCFARRGLPCPSYLLYADDIVRFCSATPSNRRQLLRILNDYASISGQCSNPSKSRAYFGRHATTRIRRQVRRLLGIPEGSLPFTYLGVPILFCGSPRRALFQPLADGILAKFARWKGSTLSMAGRICLVESVIMGSFVHSMMSYRWPGALLKDMEVAIRN